MQRSVFVYALSFFLKNAPMILAVSFLVASGRALQVGWESYLPSSASFLLELPILAGRICIALIVIGGGAVKRGIVIMKAFFRIPQAETNAAFTRMGLTIKQRWRVILRDVILYGTAVLLLNYIIVEVAQSQEVYSLLTHWGMPGGDEETVESAATLILKNLTVIPFTIVFQFGLLGYLLHLKPFDQPSDSDVRLRTSTAAEVD